MATDPAKAMVIVPQSNDTAGTVGAPARKGGGPRLVVSNNDTDTMLVVAAVGGDRSAFATLVKRHLSRSVGTARRLLGSDMQAEDVAQEAFVRLWNRIGDLDVGQAGVWPWLRRVVFNLCMDRRRAERDTVPDALEFVAGDEDQHRDLEAADVALRVEAAISTLPERQQAAIGLFHYEGYTVKEIAATMDSTADAVESLLGRARRALKSALSEEWKEMLPDGHGSSGTATAAVAED